jgi:hypothetical protein
MTWEAFLQFLNLPTFLMAGALVYRAGRLVQTVEEHGRRIRAVEKRVMPERG